MVSVRPKTAETYLATYQNLLDKAKQFDHTTLDKDSQPDSVQVDQMVFEGCSDEKTTQLQLSAQLQSGTVSAEYTPGPNSGAARCKISFRPEGELLHVEETGFLNSRSTGKQRSFSVHTGTKTIQDVREQVIEQPQAAALDANLERQMDTLGNDLMSLGFTICGGFPKL